MHVSQVCFIQMISVFSGMQGAELTRIRAMVFVKILPDE